MQDFVAVQSKSGKIHAVYANGTLEDGSLYHFHTQCSQRINDACGLEPEDQWHELDDYEGLPTCGNCLRSYNAYLKTHSEVQS